MYYAPWLAWLDGIDPRVADLSALDKSASHAIEDHILPCSEPSRGDRIRPDVIHDAEETRARSGSCVEDVACD